MVTEPLAKSLARLAKREPHVEVRSQLAATSKRLPANQALPIIRLLMEHDEDSGDIYQPLMVWWALESKLKQNAVIVLDFFEEKSIWQKSLVREHLLDRLIRRFSKAGMQKDLLSVARLFELAPDADSAAILMSGFEQAYKGRSMADLPERLMRAMAQYGGGSVVLEPVSYTHLRAHETLR